MDVEEIGRRIAAIREDRERGAAQLALDVVNLLMEMAVARSLEDESFAELFPHASLQVARARPSMAPLLNGAGTLLAAWRNVGGAARPARGRGAVVEAATSWIARQQQALSLIAGHGAGVLGGTVITLSYSSTVMAALKLLWERDRLSGVIVSESRPLFEGRRTATELASAGIPVALVTDAQMGVFVSTANAAIVGADTLMTGGAVVNKAGTLLLALAAYRARVPFYVAADSQKIAPAPGHHRRMPFTMEEGDPDEVLPEPVSGVAVRNTYFDLTPGRYVTGYITEEGILGRKEITARARRASGAVFMR